MEQLLTFRFRKVSLRKLSAKERREMRQGLTFISPWIVGFLAFTFLPMLATFIFTFLDMRITEGVFNPVRFVGLDNYKTLFKDMTIWRVPSLRVNWTQQIVVDGEPKQIFAPQIKMDPPGAMWVTIIFGLYALPVGILLPLALALLLNSKYLKGQAIFRSLFYMPYVIPFVASVFLWGGMLNPETGWINRFLMWLGVPKAALPQWANDVFWVYPTYVIMGIWGVGNAMLIMLAGLQNVPTELYDAAKVDGAGSWATFWKVTWPMISPVIFYNLILNVVGLFQYFLVPLVVNQGTGRPGGATYFYNLHLYKTFFLFQNMSYGATMAWILFLVILIVTIILFGTAKKWVYYAAEST